MALELADMEEGVLEAIEAIRPALQSDGGDIVYRGKNSVFYFPLATCILVSVVLSLVLFVVNRMRR